MIPIASPVVEEAEADAARDAVLSGWISQGPRVAAFEAEFARLVEAPYACAVSNCTTALHLAFWACGIGEGDEVITTSHSFIATANSIRYCGARPVFVDIEPDTFNIDPRRVADAITPRTAAILAVHQMGMPCDLPALLDIADRHGLLLVEDAACAAGSRIRLDGTWESVGKPRGAFVCFSFHPRKVITTGEGGMLTTAIPDLDRKVRLGRQHGMSVSDAVRHESRCVVFEEYRVLGFNYRMTDIQAAIGRKQLERLPQIVARRRALATRYAELLAGIDGVRVPVEPEWAQSNWQSYAVGLPDGTDQKDVMQRLLDAGISTRRGIMCSHREAPYAEQKQRHDLRNSEAAQDHTVLLPIYPQMSDDDVEIVVTGLKRALAAH